MAQAISERGEDPTEYCDTDNPDRIVLTFLGKMQKEFTDRTDILYAQISALNDEILGLKLATRESPPSPTPAPKPESTSAPAQALPPPSKPAQAAPAPIWATVAKK